MRDNYNGSTILLAFLAGAAAGAVAAFLTAPKSGRETREDLKNWGVQLSGKARRVPPAVRHAYDRASSAAVEAFKESLVDGDARTNG